MKGQHDKIYIVTKERNSVVKDCDFNQLRCTPPKDGRMYKTYIQEHLVLQMLEKLKVVCGHSAMRYVEKEIERIKK